MASISFRLKIDEVGELQVAARPSGRPAQPFIQEPIDQRIGRTRPRHDGPHPGKDGMVGFLRNPTKEHQK
jgi:hypothetical protein